MMESYSEREPPNNDEIERCLYNDVIVALLEDRVPVPDETLVRSIVHDEFVKYGGREALGSLAGWLAFTRNELKRIIVNAIIECVEADVENIDPNQARFYYSVNTSSV